MARMYFYEPNTAFPQIPKFSPSVLFLFQNLTKNVTLYLVVIVFLGSSGLWWFVGVPFYFDDLDDFKEYRSGML